MTDQLIDPGDLDSLLRRVADLESEARATAQLAAGRRHRRSRRRVGLLAVGAALVGGLTLASASGGGSAASVYVPITPCRLFDTRPGANIGPRTTPLTAGETLTVQVTGSNGQCTIPASATAIVINTTAVGPTASTYLTMFPADATLPNASNLNVSAGQAPAPNLVTVTLSATGAIKIFNAFGSVSVFGDIAGYYQSAQGSGVANRASNEQIALLQWGRLKFPAGDAPSGVAYDGSYVWVTNQTADTVSRINPVTGAKVDFATGDGPSGLAYDGTSIWVANFFGSTVSKINPATGMRTDYPAGVDTAPYGVAYDGTSIWVTNFYTASVSKFNTETGTFTTYPTGGNAFGVVYDGTYIWVTNYSADTLSKINPATGAEISETVIGNGPSGIAFDGANLWVANQDTNTVSKINPGTLTKFDFVTGTGAFWVAYDGTDIWVTNYAADTVSRLSITGTVLATYLPGDFPVGIAFDGNNVWIANNLDDNVTRIPV